MMCGLLLAATLLQNCAAVSNAAVQIDAAIVAKGGTTAGGLTNAAAAIAALPSVGGSTHWRPPYGWPDMGAIYDADAGMAGYSNKCYMLYHTAASDTALIRTYQMNGIKTVTSDGVTYSTLGSWYHTWSTEAISNGYAWIVFYYNQPDFQLQNLYQGYTSAKQQILWIIASTPITCGGTINYYWSTKMIETPRIKPVGGATRCFYSCTALDFLPETVIDLSLATSLNCVFAGCASLPVVRLTNCPSLTMANGLFQGCYGLTRIDGELDTSAAQDVSLMFYQCESLVALPETLDFSSVTSANNQKQAFHQMYGLRYLPRHYTSNWSFSFQFSNGITRDSFLAFIDGLNTCPNASQTATFLSDVKNRFTADEQAALAAQFTAKNWTLAW